MDRKTMVQILGPSAAIGLIVVLLGLLLAPSGGTSDSETESRPVTGSAAPPVTNRGDASGMSDRLPPLDDPAWQDGPEPGLKVWDVAEGTGEAVPPGAKVRVHYTGWLTNGNVFDSSVRRGESVEFSLNGVIRGWTVGIPGMKIDSIRRLYIPPELGYGSRGSGGSIPPNSPLVFEVKLLGFSSR